MSNNRPTKARQIYDIIINEMITIEGNQLPSFDVIINKYNDLKKSTDPPSRCIAINRFGAHTYEQCSALAKNPPDNPTYCMKHKTEPQKFVNAMKRQLDSAYNKLAEEYNYLPLSIITKNNKICKLYLNSLRHNLITEKELNVLLDNHINNLNEYINNKLQ